ncbi:hypothetical protein GCM10010531_44740 [Blastococcus jejuensis]|uniref:Uncharacterized protein n=1 Tax=Blastococcus jejuensis TaxID=351224 RepID=A0ABP6PT13_9ACTN
MDDRIKQAGQFIESAVKDAIGQKVSEHGDHMFQSGFSSAAGITLRRIDAKLESFEERMKGSGLTKTEQAVCAQLDELKAEIEADCDRFWRGSGVEWRPPKQIAKGVRRSTQEPQL